MFVNFVVLFSFLFSFLFLFLFSLKVERVKRKQQTEFRQITHRDWNAKLIVNFFIFCMDQQTFMACTHVHVQYVHGFAQALNACHRKQRLYRRFFFFLPLK